MTVAAVKLAMCPTCRGVGELTHDELEAHENKIRDPEFLLTRDLYDAAATLTDREVRYLVDLYYQLQEYRKASDNMIRSTVGKEPNRLLAWYADRMDGLERRIPTAMKRYAAARRDGRWAMSIHGIGPVIAAGLLASIEIEKAPTVGHIWSFAGLNPDMKWEKGQKRPFSLRMKVLCWKIGQSFMKQRASEHDVYGKIYEQRKAIEIERNDLGAHAGYELKGYAEFRKKINVPSGPVPMLPPGIIDARARRYAVKLFLSHLHHVMFECKFGKEPPKPYILTKPEHVHYLGPPNWPCE